MTPQKRFTRKQYEEHLNDLFDETYAPEKAYDEYIYLTSKNRLTRTTEHHLKACILDKRLGSLIRRLDPALFNTGYNDFVRV